MEGLNSILRLMRQREDNFFRLLDFVTSNLNSEHQEQLTITHNFIQQLQSRELNILKQEQILLDQNADARAQPKQYHFYADSPVASVQDCWNFMRIHSSESGPPASIMTRLDLSTSASPKLSMLKSFRANPQSSVPSFQPYSSTVRPNTLHSLRYYPISQINWTQGKMLFSETYIPKVRSLTVRLVSPKKVKESLRESQTEQ